MEEQTLKIANTVLEYRRACEANVVSILWKNPELFYEYDNLNYKDFHHNCWKVYFVIGHGIIIREQKKVLDDITVGLFLEKHDKLVVKYNEYGGWRTIEDAKKYVEESNLDGYIKQLNKWKMVGKLLTLGFPIADRLKDFVDMDLQEIYDEYDGLLNHIFINVDSEDEVHDLTDRLPELIEEMDAGMNVGLPLNGLKMLTSEIGGNLGGNITLACGITGAGKSSVTRNVLIPSVLKSGDSMLFMINEEDEKKVKSEVMIYVVNNILLKDSKETLRKIVVRDGKYSQRVKDLLKKASEWMMQYKDRIKIIPFKKYTTSKAIKCIKKFSALGFRYFCLDTFKRDFSENLSAEDHKVLSKSMSDLYDTIKPSGKNVHLWVSAQLTKGSDRQRYLGLSDLGISKNMQDTVSTVLMIRKIYSDEFQGEKREIFVYKNIGKTKTPVILDPDKQYNIIFIPKNRFGGSDKQIVMEHCLSTNVYREVGYCSIPRDY